MAENRKERTFLIIKPDGVERGLVGKILVKIEELGLRVGKIKSLTLSVSECRKLYAKTRETLPEIYEMVERHMTKNVSIAAIIEGGDTVKKLRELRGPTNLLVAPPGTIRRDLITDEVRELFRRGIYVGNLVHASGDEKEAEFEIDLFFGERS